MLATIRTKNTRLGFAGIGLWTRIKIACLVLLGKSFNFTGTAEFSFDGEKSDEPVTLEVPQNRFEKINYGDGL